MATERNLVSLVVRRFNEDDVIEETHRRLFALVASQPVYGFEFLFGDDAGHDRTPQLLSQLVANDLRARVMFFYKLHWSLIGGAGGYRRGRRRCGGLLGHHLVRGA